MSGKKRTLCGKKRTYSQTETRIQNGGLKYEIFGTRRWKAVRPRFKEADLQPNGNGNPEPRSWRENGGLEKEKASSGRWVERSGPTAKRER